MQMNQFRAKCAFILVFAVAAALWAQPQLTTIDDVVYRADGQRFTGLAMIEYRSFLAADASVVASYSKTVSVVDGVLKVSLVPTTTAAAGAYYIVRYVSNGRIQFTEYWAVPPSTSAVKLKDVRLIGPPLAGSSTLPPGNQGPVQISDVVGLTDELAARARKGLSFTPSRAAVINANGELETATGNPTDCVRADGSSGPCDLSSLPSFVDQETPAGLVNGTNASFTLSNAPAPPASLQLFRNGVMQQMGTDYTLAGNIITFQAGAIPQPGDVLSASYRIAPVSGQTGAQAGGALTGYYPSPSIAPGAITNVHVAASAGIAESKLALNFPTHSNVNDPTPDQKAALAGTSGIPSNTNRYVTDSDARLSNARPPTQHPLLGSAHYDTNPGVVARGDLIVGMGTSPASWTRLPLGPANRCLTSNGFDALWNACLFTGFPAGAVPFTDSSGTLAHNVGRLFWDNTTARLAIGTNLPASTLTVHDAASGTGQTTLTVRAGDAQGATPLQRWLDGLGADLAKVEADGRIQAAGVRASSTGTRAAWQDTGTTADPSPATDGALWYNNSEHARKSAEAGQTHVLPQVICAFKGLSTNATTLQSIGHCRIPAAMVRNGDRFEIRWEISHEGAGTAFSYSLYWGAVAMLARSAAATESLASGRSDAVVENGTLYFSWQNWGATTGLLAGTGSSTGLPTADVIVDVRGQMAAATSETVTLRNLSVLRLPAQTNP